MSTEDPKPARATAEEWAARFQAEHGREPSMTEYRAAVEAGEVRADQSRSVQQMSDGMRQVAAGARGFFDERVAPAARDARARVERSTAAAREEGGLLSQIAPWARVAAIAEAGVAFVSIFTLFLPAATSMGVSASMMDGEDGPLLLVLFLATVGAAVTLVLTGARWARWAAGIIGGLTGLVAVIDGFWTLMNVRGEPFISAGPGAVLLGLMGALLLLLALVVLLVPAQPGLNLGGTSTATGGTTPGTGASTAPGTTGTTDPTGTTPEGTDPDQDGSIPR